MIRKLTLLFHDIWEVINDIWHSPFSWVLILTLTWVFRVSAVPADNGGIAKMVQVGSIFALLYICSKNMKNAFLVGWKEGNTALKWMMAYLLLGVISTLWSYMPQFSFFLSVEKIIMLSVIFMLFYQTEDFFSAERVMVLSLTGLLVFEAFAWRTYAGMSFFTHSLTNGACAAMLISYCSGEWLSDKTNNEERRNMFKSVIVISTILLISSTSGGANACAVFGVGLALFFSGNRMWASLLLLIGIVLYLNQDMIDDLLFFIMPGKTQESLTTATGRTSIWELIELYGSQKPLFGWGYAAIERYISDRDFPLTDVHNNWYGAYGGTGIVGAILLVAHQASQIWINLVQRLNLGYTGLLSAVCCATLNGYSYGFLSGKACSTTIFYFVLIIAVIRFAELQDAND